MDKKVNATQRIISNPSSGERAADAISKWAGSWTFIFIFLGTLVVWMILNTANFIFHWDEYPFILLNLVLSCLAAIQAPVILMSQNRAAKKDRQRMEYDYSVNRKAERGIEEIKKKLNSIERKISKK